MSVMPPELPGVQRERAHQKTMRIVRIVLWILWGLLLFGPFSFACVIGLILSNPSTQPRDPQRNVAVLMFVGVMGAVTSIGIAHGIRALVLHLVARKNRWGTMVVVYPIMKITTWCVCVGATQFSLVICLIVRSFWPALLMAILTWLVVAV